MNLSVFNGSPRGKESNSRVILKWISEGMGRKTDPRYLRKTKEHEAFAEELATRDGLVLVFPLYADAMPGVVMAFFETLYARRKQLTGKAYLFVVHSGFPEGCQSLPVKRYLENFVRKMDGRLLGVVIQGGSEGTRLQPEAFQKKNRKAYRSIGKALASGEAPPAEALKSLYEPEALSESDRARYRFMGRIGLSNLYWDMQLKKNKAFDKRFDRPYV